jgi:hypothetical protein
MLVEMPPRLRWRLQGERVSLGRPKAADAAEGGMAQDK